MYAYSRTVVPVWSYALVRVTVGITSGQFIDLNDITHDVSTSLAQGQREATAAAHPHGLKRRERSDNIEHVSLPCSLLDTPSLGTTVTSLFFLIASFSMRLAPKNSSCPHAGIIQYCRGRSLSQHVSSRDLHKAHCLIGIFWC